MSYRSTHHGFTLIEILIVVVVVSIAMSVVVATFSGGDRSREYAGYMQRLAVKVEMARDKAMQRNREWGLHIQEEGIVFSEFDDVNQLWVVQTQRPFNPSEFAQNLEFSVEVEAFAGIDVSADNFARPEEDGFSLNNDGADEAGEADFPDVVIFSSGEVTPFELTAELKDWEGDPMVLVSDGFTRARLQDPAES